MAACESPTKYLDKYLTQFSLKLFLLQKIRSFKRINPEDILYTTDIKKLIKSIEGRRGIELISI